MNQIDHPLTVKWVLFGFKGRIGRKSFLLAGLLLILVQLALFAYAARYAAADQEAGKFRISDPSAAFAGLAMIISWFVSAWALLALAVKRLHDLSLPVALGVCLVFPGISFFAWVFLAAAPSKQAANEHGPVPFPNTSIKP